MTRKIMLDTNFLVAPFQFSVDIFGELEEMYPFADVYTLESAVEEARSIEGGKFRDLVPELLEKKDVEIVEAEGSSGVDDLLVDASRRFIVATNDKELKRRIRDRDRPVIILRSKSHLELRGNDGDF